VVNDVRTAEPTLTSDEALEAPDLVTASVTLPPDRYPTPEARVGFYRRVTERVGAIPTVNTMSIASVLPLSGAVERRLEMEGERRAPRETGPSVWTAAIDVDYFQTLGLPMTRGREFDLGDGAPGQQTAVVNQRFAEMFFAHADPIGRRVGLSAVTEPQKEVMWLTIVGISPTVRQRGGAPDPLVYLPLRAVAPPTVSLLIRATGDLAHVTPLLREEMRVLDPALPLYRVLTMPQVVDQQAWVRRMSSGILRFLTLVALGLAVVGLYAVMSHAVAQRTQELGLRMALGAQPRQLGRLILVRALGHVAAGLVAGIVCTLAWDAAFFSGRVDARFADPNVLVPVALLLTLVTILACAVPVRRATRLNPVVALRQE
jgi:putative ABC transport system permease protein